MCIRDSAKTNGQRYQRVDVRCTLPSHTVDQTGHMLRHEDSPPVSTSDAVRTVKVNEYRRGAKESDPRVTRADRLNAVAATPTSTVRRSPPLQSGHMKINILVKRDL